MNFDKTENYNSNILPILEKLKKACIKNEIPFFFAACVKNDENTSEYEKEIYSGLAHDISLTKDYIPDLVKITLGFEAQVPFERLELDPNDF